MLNVCPENHVMDCKEINNNYRQNFANYSKPPDYT